MLVGGYLFFPAKAQDSQQLLNNMLGVSVAMVGVILYGHLKHTSSQDKPDCLDNTCPGCLLIYIEPKYSMTDSGSEEMQGLKTASSG